MEEPGWTRKSCGQADARADGHLPIIDLYEPGHPGRLTGKSAGQRRFQFFR
jgi:hypothetical protein